MNGFLSDALGRQARKLRVSVTRGCSLRCLYCGGGKADGGELSAREIVRLVGILVDLGIEEIRLTGGEPLERHDIDEVLRGLSGFSVRRAITTNGQDLERHAALLSRCGFDTVNISLDSLDSELFGRLTGGGELARTLSGIEAARAEGLSLKFNCVALSGMNDGEFSGLHAYAGRLGAELRFLELLPAGPGRHLQEHFLPSEEIRSRLEAEIGPLTEIAAAEGSTSRRFRSQAGVAVGFISGVSHPFCGSCTRLRLSADGVLYPCLFGTQGEPLRDASREQVAEGVERALAAKPGRRAAETARPLGVVGG